MFFFDFIEFQKIWIVFKGFCKIIRDYMALQGVSTFQKILSRISNSEDTRFQEWLAPSEPMLSFNNCRQGIWSMVYATWGGSFWANNASLILGSLITNYSSGWYAKYFIIYYLAKFHCHKTIFQRFTASRNFFEKRQEKEFIVKKLYQPINNNNYYYPLKKTEFVRADQINSL